MKSLLFSSCGRRLKSSRSFFITALSVGSFFFLSSCNSSKQTSGILADTGTCVGDCTAPQTTIEGNLGIEADTGTYYQNVDQGDRVEIAGKCDDLGRRNNRILVEVYEGEDHPDAYIDNSRSVNCENSLTPALNNQRCFWITQGRGIVDNGLEYPQCFNGKFSFSIRLGRIIRTIESVANASSIIDDALNPRKKYLVRFKLRTQDNGAIAETPWNSTLVDRGVTKVTFSQETVNGQTKLQVNAYKTLDFLTDISYTGTLTREYVNNPTPTAPMIIMSSNILAYPIIDGSNVTSYYSTNLTPAGGIIPGVKHRFQFVAEDRKYDYSLLRFGGVVETSSLSEELEVNPRPSLGGESTYPDNACPGVKQCTLNVSFVPAFAAPYMQWAALKNKTGTWDLATFEPLPAEIITPGLCSGTSCIFNPTTYSGSCAAANGTYQIAVRYNDGVNKGLWSNYVQCQFSH